MSAIFGHLNISDTDRAFNTTVGQRVIWEATQAYIARANAELDAAMRLFVERTTDEFKLRYKLPGGGYLQQRGLDGRYGSVKALGNWDVAFPLRDYGAQVSGNDVAMAYMTVAELDRHIQTVVIQDYNTVRYQILHRLFKSTDTSFADDLHGTLTVVGLANGDTVTYPPVVGATAEATDNHYLESGYAAADISDVNDPYPTIVAELEEHFGSVAGGSNIVVFINVAEQAETEALTDFYEVSDQFIQLGVNTDRPVNMPALPSSARIIGRHKAGCWIAVWNFIPANYMLGLHLEAEAPLIMRVDPADTGLGQGLQLVSEDEEFPFMASFWRHRFGFGVGNRLNGVVMELGTGGTYTAPNTYA